MTKFKIDFNMFATIEIEAESLEAAIKIVQDMPTNEVVSQSINFDCEITPTENVR